MKLTETKHTVQVSEQFDELQYGIREEDMGLILEILRSKMYKHPIASICREIASNSRDANREARRSKVPTVIEVIDSPFLGSDLSIAFRDTGVGISPDRMAEVFVKYGASTKRDTNSQTGGFGLGAKTPFSYSDTFSIVTNYNGMKYIYTTAIENGNRGKIYLMTSEETTERNGTSIVIPIKESDRQEFEREAVKATFFWDVRPEYKNFEITIPELDIFYRKNNAIVTIHQHAYDSLFKGNLYMIIDGIVYNVDHQALGISRNSYDNYSVFLEFNTGMLTITANRENVQYDEKTKASILRRYHTVLNAMRKEYSDYISKSPSCFEACVRLSQSKGNTVNSTSDYEDKLYYVINKETDGTPKFTYSNNGKTIEVESSANLKGVEFLTVTNRERNRKEGFTAWREFKNRPVYLMDRKTLCGKRSRAIWQTNETFVIIRPSESYLYKWGKSNFNTRRRLARKMRQYLNDLEWLKNIGLTWEMFSEVSYTKVKNANGTYTSASKVTNINIKTFKSLSFYSSCSPRRYYNSYNGLYLHDDNRLMVDGVEVTEKTHSYVVVPRLNGYDGMGSHYTTAKFLKKQYGRSLLIVNPSGEKQVSKVLKPAQEYTENTPLDILRREKFIHDIKSLKVDDIYCNGLPIAYGIKRTIKKFVALKKKYEGREQNIPYSYYAHLPEAPFVRKIKKAVERAKKEYGMLNFVGNYNYIDDGQKVLIEKYIETVNTENGWKAVYTAN